VEPPNLLEANRNRSHQEQHVGVCQSDNSSTTVAGIRKYHIVPIFQSASGEKLYRRPSRDPDIKHQPPYHVQENLIYHDKLIVAEILLNVLCENHVGNRR
jgi:hypothetical protein